MPLVAIGIMAGPTLVSISLRLGEAASSISRFLLLYTILIFYSISGYGLYKAASQHMAQGGEVRAHDVGIKLLHSSGQQ